MNRSSRIPTLRRSICASAASVLMCAGSIAVISAPASASSAPRLDGHTCTQWTKSGTNRLVATKPGSVLCALGGNHTLSAGRTTGTVILLARNGTNSLIASSARNSHDTLRADTGTAHLIGGAGNDTLIGGTGHVVLTSGTGENSLTAGSGTTSLSGGSGDDSLNGGSGSDTFTAGSGTTTITFGSGPATVNCGTSAGTVTVIGENSRDHEASDCHSGNVEHAGMGFAGVVTAVSASVISVTYSHASSLARAWLSANGNPTSVDFDTSTATITRLGGGSVQVGDHVHVEANAPTTGTTLIAVSVEAEVEASQEWSGRITGVAGSIITVQYFDVSDSAQGWLDANGDPASVSFDVTSATIERFGGGSLQVGDFVKIDANAPSSGTTLVAVAVEAFAIGQQRWLGAVSAVSATTIDVTYSEANFAAHSWLSANGSPTTVTFDVSSATVFRVGGGSIQVGDLVSIESNPPASGTTLVAVRVFAEAPASQLWAGKVTATGATTIDVQFFAYNGAAKTWLDANGDPTTVTFDISSATINRAGGGAVQVGDLVAVRSNPPSSGTTLVGVQVFAAAPGSFGGGGEGGGSGFGGGGGESGGGFAGH